MIRPILIDELPLRYDVSKHAYKRLKERFPKLFASVGSVDEYLKQIAIEGEVFYAPAIAAHNGILQCRFGKTNGKVKVFVRVNLTDSFELEQRGLITSIGGFRDS